MVQSISEQQRAQVGGSSLVVPSYLFPLTGKDGTTWEGDPIASVDYNFPPTEKVLNRETDTAFEFIKEHYNKDENGKSVEGGRVTLIGFSYGGVMALNLARRLEKAGIPVRVMGLLDATAGSESENVNRTVSDNVAIVKSYYQTSLENTVKSFGAPVRRKDGSTRFIRNIKVTVNHEEMDTEYGEALLNWVLKQLEHEPKK